MTGTMQFTVVISTSYPLLCDVVYQSGVRLLFLIGFDMQCVARSELLPFHRNDNYKPSTLHTNTNKLFKCYHWKYPEEYSFVPANSSIHQFRCLLQSFHRPPEFTNPNVLTLI